MNLPPKVTPRAFERLSEIGAAAQGQALRVAVEGGGCSGFQYEIKLDAPGADDLVLEGGGENVGGDPNMGLMRYAVPVQVPAGFAGVTPQLSFGYASGAGSTMLGMGWSLALPC